MLGVFLYCDLALMSLCFLYFLYVIASLSYQTYRR